jgi:hypothetical protein
MSGAAAHDPCYARPVNPFRPIRRSSQRNALLCALAVGICWLLTVPRLNAGINDDFSYTKSAFDFARTGHFHYNGWAAAILGWQIVWGGAFAKLFGESFNAVRLSMLPIAMGCVYVFYCVLVRFGVSGWNAVIGTLTMGLSPMFLALSTSFMSDVPALFCIIVCLYMCQRAIQAQSDRATVLWLASAAAANVVGGTVRQIVWFGALAMVPATAWLLRRRRHVVPVAAAAWIASVLCIVMCLRWFRQQPFEVVQQLWDGPLGMLLLLKCGIEILFFALTLLLFMLPLLVCLIPVAAMRPRAYRSTAFIVSGVMAAAFLLWLTHNPAGPPVGPWLQNVVSPYGMQYVPDVGPLPIVLTKWVWLAFTVVLLISLASWWAVARGSSAACEQPAGRHPAYGVGALTIPFVLCYMAPLLPWAAYLTLFDRYTLPVFPMFILGFLTYYQKRVRAQLPSLSIAVLALFAFYAVAATHDSFATRRARLAAAGEVERSGIPRTHIHGSLEYDGWTQLQTEGHINDARIVLPAGAYRPALHLHPLPAECSFYYADLFPAVDAQYFVTAERLRCFQDSPFAPVTYPIWLPPFARTLHIEELPSPGRTRHDDIR